MKEESKKKSSKTTKKAKEEKVVIAGVEANPNRKDVVGAIFLLFIGIMLLLNSLDLIDWTIWGYLWRFWPVFLILGGVRMIVGHSKVANWVVSILALIIFGFVGALAFFSYSNREKDDVTKTEINVLLEDYENVESIDLDVEIGAFDVMIHDNMDTSVENFEEKYLLTRSYSYKDFGYPYLDENFENGILNLDFEPQFKNLKNRYFHFGSENMNYDVILGQTDIPADVSLELGAGKGNVLFSEQEITALSTKVGAGQLSINLSEESIPSEGLILEVGAGQIILELPKNVGLEISYELGLGEISFEDQPIASVIGSSQSSFKSPNYEEAETILLLDASVGVGALNIRYNQND